MDNIEQLQLLQLKYAYNTYATICNGAMSMLLAQLEIMKQTLDCSGKYNPISEIKSRIKDFQSVLDKLARKSKSKTMENIKGLHDVAGTRIIVKYRDDIYTIRDLIVKSLSLKVETTKDYVANPKESGYQSLHLLVKIPVPTDIKEVPVEIQIRSEAMDFYASIEHFRRYKNANPSSEMEKEMHRLAETCINLDDSLMRLRDAEEKAKHEEESEEVGLSIQIEDSDD